METVDVLSVGRISVDLYSMEPNIGFDGQQNFQKSVGGSPTNVAVAAAQLGLRVGLATKVGDDAFGDYVKGRLAGWGVDTDFVGTVNGAQTPLAFAALTPPESPTVIFYRGRAAPDTTLATDDVPADVVRGCRILWVSQASLAQGSTADTCLEWMSMRSRDDHTILDLDYRASLWASPEDARVMAGRAIALAAGWNAFQALLDGAWAMDCHFRDTPLEDNLPVILGLVGVWHVNALGYRAQAILPYDARLHRFAAHLQQLEMESNGKSVLLDGGAVGTATCPVIFGEPGTDAQHSFMQLIHQGTSVIPVDFLLAVQAEHGRDGAHRILAANAFAQAEALLAGKTRAQVEAEMRAAQVESVKKAPKSAPKTTPKVSKTTKK
jgi:hypothetical protein